jgi:hypothetical protein
MIYFLRSYNNHIKIGTSSQIDERVSTLQTSNPNKLHVQAILEGSFQTESELHSIFEKYRVRGEWFKYSEEIKWFIRAIQENPEINNIYTLHKKSLQMRIEAKAKRLKSKGNDKLFKKIEILK